MASLAVMSAQHSMADPSCLSGEAEGWKSFATPSVWLTQVKLSVGSKGGTSWLHYLTGNKPAMFPSHFFWRVQIQHLFSPQLFKETLWLVESDQFKMIWWGHSGNCAVICEEMFKLQVLGRKGLVSFSDWKHEKPHLPMPVYMDSPKYNATAKGLFQFLNFQQRKKHL